MSSPSELLEGLEINGWNVISQIGVYPGMTGGNFSTGYLVEKLEQQGFMKAMDLYGVIPRGLEAITNATSQFTFEKDILTYCMKCGLSGIVRLIEYGEIDPKKTSNPLNIIYYMIFERADGDIRREITFSANKLSSWKLCVLHYSTKALVQLHGADIAHQDVKPSNVLAFNKSEEKFKLSDLGRSSSKHLRAPTDAEPFPGDLSYAPPEYHYGFTPSEYHDKRLGSDAFLLGSLLAFLYSGVGALLATIMGTPEEYRPGQWKGNYKDVLPFLIKAHSEATQALLQHLPPEHRDEMGRIYFNLCHPDPSQRGHPDARRQSGRPIGLDRYRSVFDRLMKQALLNERLELIGAKSA